jgi:hypothetical protein
MVAERPVSGNARLATDDYADERLGVDDLELARELAAGLSGEFDMRYLFIWIGLEGSSPERPTEATRGLTSRRRVAHPYRMVLMSQWRRRAP